MVYTNFPQGVTSLGVPVIGSGQLPITAGNYWFVSSVLGSAGNPGNEADLPFATLMNAVNAAASGDIIVLLPNHAETIVAAAGVLIATAGLTVIGMGEGASRPTFTFTTSTAATFRVTGASFQISNIVGVCGIDQIVSPFVIAAADCTLGLPGAPVEWQDGSAIIEALRAVLTTAAASRLTINMVYRGFTAGSHGVNAIRLVGVATANININYYGVLTTAVVEFLTTACTNVQVSGYMYVSGITNFSRDVVDTVTGSTWFAAFFDGAYGGSVSGGSGAALASDDVSAIVASAEAVAFKAAATLTNGQTLFTVAGGPIQVVGLVSICVTANDGTASTLQYSATPTAGSAQTISGASASLASAAIGASVALAGTALATAALLNANGPNLIANPGTIMVPAGIITAVVGVGSTTGTWKHYLRYRPLAAGVTVS